MFGKCVNYNSYQVEMGTVFCAQFKVNHRNTPTFDFVFMMIPYNIKYGLNKSMISVLYSGLDYSSPWHNDFLDAVEAMQCNLHVTHPSMQIVLGMCQTSLGQLLLVDLKGQRAQGPVECEHLKNNVILECEKMEER